MHGNTQTMTAPRLWLPVLLTFGLVLAAVQTARAGTLENMERERALLLETLLSADMSVEDRQKSIGLSRTRLVDLERMVLRDKSLEGRNTPRVRAAFENYDLTFLVHASTEKNRSLMDHWLAEIGVSTQTLMNARAGRR
jgi:hypothetical protein